MTASAMNAAGASNTSRYGIRARLDSHLRAVDALPEGGNCLEQVVAARSHCSGDSRIFRSREICYAGFPFSEVNVYVEHVNQTVEVGNQRFCLRQFARGGDNSKMTRLFHFVTSKWSNLAQLENYGGHGMLLGNTCARRRSGRAVSFTFRPREDERPIHRSGQASGARQKQAQAEPERVRHRASTQGYYGARSASTHPTAAIHPRLRALAKQWPSPLSLAATEWLSGIRMRKANKGVRALLLSSLLLVGGALVQSANAQDGKRSKDDAPYLGASEIAFEWQYSCPGEKACSFSCPGSGGASNVKALTLQLGTIPLSGNQRAFGVFYKFSTLQIPRANGFSITTGISTLSCQVNGMDLDYSGPRKSVDSSAPTAGVPSQEGGSRAQLR